MNRSDIKKFIDKNQKRHLSNKVLHAHPSPSLWKTEANSDDLLQSLTTSESEKVLVNMYVGIPYCLPTDPPHCGFCLFPTEKYGGSKSTQDYLNYVSKEADLYSDFYKKASLKSLYVGGGTPNLMVAEDYPRLMKIVDKLFPATNDYIEKTIEGIPQLFNENKIRAISEAGFNRVSMGVQQVTDRLIKYSGRKQTEKQVFDAIELFDKYQLACNIDLIYGWPEQSISDMLGDLGVIADSGIKHITHYELNIAGRSDFSTKKKTQVPSISQKIEMYHASKEYLISRNYKQITVYDWEYQGDDLGNRGKYLYESNLRDFIDEKEEYTSCMGGIGYAAINIRTHPLSTKVPSCSSMNHRNLERYYDDINNGVLPIERSFFHEAEDLRMIWLFQALQEMKIDVKKYNSLFPSSLNEFEEIWKYLEELGWLSRTDEQLLLINDGEFYVPLIQSLLSSDRIEELRKRTSSKSPMMGAKEVVWLKNA